MKLMKMEFEFNEKHAVTVERLKKERPRLLDDQEGEGSSERFVDVGGYEEGEEEEGGGPVVTVAKAADNSSDDGDNNISINNIVNGE
ncbi:unnamed protein product [Microthlaspi erraticum]|uniref:Uncharacterized protein n=1 Tax=Microthlaspi erraticum TaxID=1685480 RepID=A0A6D2HX21_9BRAS|nr:unnamed protein product [Microthlaspi erraticum]